MVPTDDVDAEIDPDPDDPSANGDGSAGDGGVRSRTVAVPLRLYKTVTVFSTLLAILGVVLGFVLLDHATDRARADVANIDPVVALLGLALVVAAAVIYAFSTRFRAVEMGKSKDASDEASDDG